VGGGMCQFTNLLHWMALHSDLTITERHHHDGYDLFPDFGRQVPFGVGTSILYNYLDYRLRNDTPDTFQILVHSDGQYLRGQLRCTKSPCHVWHISCEEEHFSREMDGWYRNNKVFRQKVDKRTGQTVEKTLLQTAHAKVLYDEQYIDPKKRKDV
jgi:vancomycin resistance protein VanW